MAAAAVRSKVMMLILPTHCLLLLPLCVGFCVWSWFCDISVSILGLQSFGMKRERLALISMYIIIEPVHEISNNVVCATSKASDQPAHTRSLIRAFACRLSIL